MTELPFEFVVRADSFVLDLLAPKPVLSSAPFRGGWGTSRYFLNRTVSSDFCPEDISAALLGEVVAVGLPPEQTTCAVTAVNVAKYAAASATEEAVTAHVYLTAGIGNLSAPGRSPLASHKPGTINIFALLQAELPQAALVEAVQIVTEVKARVLRHKLTTEGFPATGTSTDTVMIAVLGGNPQPYCGAVTPMGYSLGKATEDALCQAIDKL
jgi:adenosylcobinamide amidohydrolase